MTLTRENTMFVAILVVVLLSGVVVALSAPLNLKVIVYKMLLVSIGALMGWMINEWLVKIENEIAQAILIGIVIHSVAGGL